MLLNLNVEGSNKEGERFILDAFQDTRRYV